MMTRRAILSAAVLVALAGVTVSRVTGQTAGQSNTARIGEFTIQNMAASDTDYDPRGNRITFDLTGPRLIITSALYEMAAPRIQLVVRRTGPTAPFKAATADATGGVLITVRRANGQAKQTTIVTCDNAAYTAATVPPVQGRIDLKGNVRQTTYDPSFATPLVQTADSGYIELLPREQLRIKLRQGDLRVTPIEPAPRKPR